MAEKAQEAKQEIKEEVKPVETQKEEIKEDKGTKDNEVKGEKKTVAQKKEAPKKDMAIVNMSNVPMSTKYSAAICKFIKNKSIEDAIADLEQVIVLKKAVPMKGEIPHRRGKGMMSGRFPVRASKSFISALKTLSGNALHNGLENPVIVEAVANIGERPYGRFGRVRKKRTHLRIVAKEKSGNKEKNKKSRKK